MIEELKKIADRFIRIYEDNPKELEKYTIIKELLNKDNIFFKIDIDYAYSILRDLQIPEDKLKSVYVELLSKKIQE